MVSIALLYYIIKQTYRAKQKCVIDTPGSCPARTAKNPVVPTTVKRKAACIMGDFCLVKNATTNMKHMLCFQD